MTGVALCEAPEGCDRSVNAHGLCLMHYKRRRRNGHTYRLTSESRFFSRVAQSDDCWLWTSIATEGGYGKFGVNKRSMLAHRWSYEFLRGEIPEGLQLDHECRNTLCVNPWHLEPVTGLVNLLRGDTIIARNLAKKACDRGHPFDAANTYVCPRGRRECRRCRNAASRRSKLRRAAGTTSGG